MGEELLAGGLLADCFLQDSLAVVSHVPDQALRAVEQPLSSAETHEVVGLTLFDPLCVLRLQ